MFVDGIWRGRRESTNENKSIFKENTDRRHLGDEGAGRWADREKSKCGNDFRDRIMKLDGVQNGVSKEGGCTGVTETYGMQVKVPEQMLEELLQNDGVIDRDEGLMEKDRDKRVSTKTCLKGIGVIIGDEGLMDKDRDKRVSIKNCLEDIGVISIIGGTGVSSGGCFARRRVNAMFMAESFASGGCRGSGDRSIKTNCSNKGSSSGAG